MAAERVPALDDSLLITLRELVAELNRRVPQLECKREREIARDAAKLREEALKRIAELERAPPAP